jgi:hypothetical protein
MSEELIARLERVAAKFDKGGGDDGGEAPSVSAHTDLLKGPVHAFIEASNKFAETKKIAAWTEKAFNHEHFVMQAAVVCAKPDEKDFLKFVDPIVQVMNESGALPPKGDFFNHFKAVSEVFQACGWIMQPGPKQVITTQAEAAQLYTNKIKMWAKDKPDPTKSDHQGWVKALSDLTAAWAEYAGEYHKSGIVWKFKGANALEFKAGAPAAGGAKAEGKKSVDERLEAIAIKLERAAAKLNKGGDDGESAAVAEYKAFYAANVEAFIAAANKFPELKQLADWTKTAFDHLGKVINASSHCKKPSDADFGNYVKPIADILEASGKCDNRSPFFNHQKAFAEGIQALGWVMQPGPAAFIKGQHESAQLYLNKILMTSKDKPDPEKTNHREFVAKFKALLDAMETYAKEHHKMGLAWAPQGKKTLADFK